MRFVEKLMVLVKYLPASEIVAMEHLFAFGHVHDAHVMADTAMMKLWCKIVVDEQNQQGGMSHIDSQGGSSV
jgi:hypothetical protein